MKINKKVALLLDAGRSFDRGLLRGIAQYVNFHRPWVFIRPSAFYERFSGFAKQSLEEIRRSKPDGLIMNYTPFEEEVAALGFPVIDVPVGRIVRGVCHILCDNREAAAMAADHLIGLGLSSLPFERLYKMADNQSPMPQDRFFVAFNFYDNLNTLATRGEAATLH